MTEIEEGLCIQIIHKFSTLVTLNDDPKKRYLYTSLDGERVVPVDCRVGVVDTLALKVIFLFKSDTNSQP